MPDCGGKRGRVGSGVSEAVETSVVNLGQWNARASGPSGSSVPRGQTSSGASGESVASGEGGRCLFSPAVAMKKNTSDIRDDDSTTGHASKGKQYSSSSSSSSSSSRQGQEGERRSLLCFPIGFRLLLL